MDPRPMPNVIRFPQPAPAAPEPRHDWLLPHVATLLRYCAANGLQAEERAFAAAIEEMIAARQARRA